MQDTRAAEGEDTPEDTTTHGATAATAVTAVGAASSAPRARSAPAGRLVPVAPSDPAGRSVRTARLGPRVLSGAGRAVEVVAPGGAPWDDDDEGMSATAHSSSSRKAP